MSKSKLASVNKKSKSIPQLELQAALIASRLKQKKYKGIQIPIKETFVWTDSKIVYIIYKMKTVILEFT